MKPCTEASRSQAGTACECEVWLLRLTTLRAGGSQRRGAQTSSSARREGCTFVGWQMPQQTPDGLQPGAQTQVQSRAP